MLWYSLVEITVKNKRQQRDMLSLQGRKRSAPKKKRTLLFKEVTGYPGKVTHVMTTYAAFVFYITLSIICYYTTQIAKYLEKFN